MSPSCLVLSEQFFVVQDIMVELVDFMYLDLSGCNIKSSFVDMYNHQSARFLDRSNSSYKLYHHVWYFKKELKSFLLHKCIENQNPKIILKKKKKFLQVLRLSRKKNE